MNKISQILLNPGPVNLHPNVRKAFQNPDICHREPEFMELQRRVKTGLLDVYNAQDHKCTIITGSGTAGIEAALSGLDNILIVSNGHYGDRLRDMCNYYEITYHFEKEPWQEPLDPRKIDDYIAHYRPDFIAVVHHETSSGMLNPINKIGQVAHDSSIKLFVDAVASFGGENLDPYLIDIAVSSANKCLEGVPGLAFVLYRNGIQFTTRSMYLDVSKYEEGIPFTPAVHTFYALDAALQVYSHEGGLKARMNRYSKLSTQIRKGLKRLGIDLCLKDEYYSRILTSAYLPEGISYKVLHDELKKKGYIIYAGQGPLEDKGFRLANMGQITKEDIENLIEAISGLL